MANVKTFSKKEILAFLPLKKSEVIIIKVCIET